MAKIKKRKNVKKTTSSISKTESKKTTKRTLRSSFCYFFLPKNIIYKEKFFRSSFYEE